MRCDRPRIVGESHLLFGGGFHRAGVLVPGDDLAAVLGQPAVDGAAHAAQSDQPDFHFRLFLFVVMPAQGRDDEN